LIQSAFIILSILNWPRITIIVRLAQDAGGN
jgi:hypothetical protein